MKLYALIMLGGALGSAARYAMVLLVDARTGVAFPWGTVLVNILGSFVIGLFVGLLEPLGPVSVPLHFRLFVTIGIMGGFTTFSSFSLQTISLLHEGKVLPAAGNVLVSVTLCLLATAGGMALARLFAVKP